MRDDRIPVNRQTLTEFLHAVVEQWADAMGKPLTPVLRRHLTRVAFARSELLRDLWAEFVGDVGRPAGPVH